MRLRIGLQLSFLLLLVASRNSAWAGPFGLEFEFASTEILEPHSTKIPARHFKAILQTLKHEVYGGKGGKVKIEPFRKGSKENGDLSVSRCATYEDPEGRVWRVVPESVNTTGRDGFELVTPVLIGRDTGLENPTRDEMDLVRLLHAVEKTGQFTEGLRSSSHVTFGIEHFAPKGTGLDGNVSWLVDMILNVESRWPEIYQAIEPLRYGSLVNRFAVPLALDQRDLLRELEAMPVEHRTFDNVRAVFEKYHEKEISLKGGDPNQAWKYRAINYKKLFELGGAAFAPVLEFRIPDLQGAGNVEKTVMFLNTVLRNGARGEPGSARFLDPFQKLPPTASADAVNRLIESYPYEKYAEYLHSIGLDARIFKPLAKVVAARGGREPGFLLDQLQLEDLLRADEHEPRPAGEKPMSFGFEAEFRHETARGFVVPGQEEGSWKLGHAGYDFLSTDIGVESTGNVEVRSNGGETHLVEVLSQMAKVKGALRGSLRSFHLHIWIPKERMTPELQAEWDAWVSRVSDAIFMDRVATKKTRFSLKDYSLVRVAPDSVAQRGTVRSVDRGQFIDFEFRGLMQDLGKFELFARILQYGVRHPEWVRGYAVEQASLHVKDPNLLKRWVQEHIARYEKRNLTSQESEILQDLISKGVERDIPPVSDYENAPYLSPIERTRLGNARFEFIKGVVTVLKNATIGKYNSKAEARKQFRWRIKRWAVDADLASTIARSLLIPPGTSDVNPIREVRADHFWQPGEIMARLQSDDPEWKLEAVRALRLLPDVDAASGIAKICNDPDARIRFEAAQLLKPHRANEALGRLSVFLRDPVVEVRKAAVESLAGRTDPISLKLLTEVAAHDSHREVRAQAAISLRGRSGPGVKEALTHLSQDYIDIVRAEAMDSVFGLSTEEARPILETGKADYASIVSQRAKKHLGALDFADCVQESILMQLNALSAAGAH